MREAIARRIVVRPLRRLILQARMSACEFLPKSLSVASLRPDLPGKRARMASCPSRRLSHLMQALP